jgi:hypothetical protein
MSPHELTDLSWKDRDADASLAALRRYAENEAQEQIDWYFGKSKAKARMSAALRFVAIVFFVLGGVTPIVKATLTTAVLGLLPFDLGEAGYLLLGIATGAIALDRFFGYSSGWMRYITTALALEKSLSEFRLEWTRHNARLRGGPPAEPQLDQLILTCERFSLAVRSQVEQETNAWVIEFQSNLSHLERELQCRADEARSGNRANG